ncbi:uncharacterized protein K460DRAFT_431273 [Cucurbitaria berberidis CBS 394.84]|uniref:Uncharacterized protein n=1 Tax=Cucurbitaria berberidis CBS 394.84 TaxID=1168544 RepID=A0A9P4GIT0_9PLEO|nr:uncharacterized protein K460DRAFT_431273 [Cucurbitaria berberidis CBS 394.84]KAF1846239.1 hypothetical protein K460DRAFT_431273 [Cucurbitaria berberidis CBS 394.84]
MSTFLDSPTPSNTPHVISFHENTPKNNMTNLSCATILNSFKAPKAYLMTEDPSPNMYSKRIIDSNQPSCTSTTNLQLRQSNHTLHETLQNIQDELAAHRTIMLDVQSRVSHLELASSIDNQTDTPPNSRDMQIFQHARGRCANNATRESLAWWEACKTFAHNCDSPFDANDFLKTPKRFSGFDFNLTGLKTKPHTPTVTPEVDDVPGLSPASDRDEQSDTETHDGLNHAFNETLSMPYPRLWNKKEGGNIVERVIEFDRVKIPMPPVLQSPPRSVRSKSASVVSVDADLTALPDLPPSPPALPAVETAQRNHKGIKSLFASKALFKNRSTGKDFHPLPSQVKSTENNQ